MKKIHSIFGIVFLFISAFSLNAQEISPISMISSSNTSLTIKFESPGFEFIEVETSKGLSVIPVMQGASPM